MLSVGIKVLVDVWRLQCRWWVEFETTALTSAGHPLLVDDAVGVMLSVGIKALVDVRRLRIRLLIILWMNFYETNIKLLPNIKRTEGDVIPEIEFLAINSHRTSVENLKPFTQIY